MRMAHEDQQSEIAKEIIKQTIGPTPMEDEITKNTDKPKPAMRYGFKLKRGSRRAKGIAQGAQRGEGFQLLGKKEKLSGKSL